MSKEQGNQRYKGKKQPVSLSKERVKLRYKDTKQKVSLAKEQNSPLYRNKKQSVNLSQARVISRDKDSRQKAILSTERSSQLYRDKKQRIVLSKERVTQRYKDTKQKASLNKGQSSQLSRDKKQRIVVSKENVKQQYKDKNQGKQSYRDKKHKGVFRKNEQPQRRDKKQGGRLLVESVKLPYRNKKSKQSSYKQEGSLLYQTKKPFNSYQVRGNQQFKKGYKGRSWGARHNPSHFRGPRWFKKRDINNYRRNKNFRLMPLFYKLRSLVSKEKLAILKAFLPKVVSHRRRRGFFFNYMKKLFPSLGSARRFTNHEMLRYTRSLQQITPY